MTPDTVRRATTLLLILTLINLAASGSALYAARRTQVTIDQTQTTIDAKLAKIDESVDHVSQAVTKLCAAQSGVCDRQDYR